MRGHPGRRICPLEKSTCLPTRRQMFKAIQATKKPCLVYKVPCRGKRGWTRPHEVRGAIEEALAGIKTTDAMILGMYQKFSDQVGDNASMVREILGKTA